MIIDSNELLHLIQATRQEGRDEAATNGIRPPTPEEGARAFLEMLAACLYIDGKPAKIRTIKVVQNTYGLGLREAKGLVESRLPLSAFS